ncbi:MAG TPA: SMC-Scp complex subunit ScpB [Gemmataceae bacterium]|nr:SMC-Scp complex subunit ScpB [Gemmataceae bacterium]
MDDLHDVPDAAELGRSYQQVLGQQAVLDDALPAQPTESSAVATAPPPPRRIIEALLFVGGVPLTQARAAQIIRGFTSDQFSEAVESLNQDYRQQGRPYAIQPRGDGFVLTLRPRFRSVLEKIYGAAREARLSTAAVDVLSLVAYRQPATKQEIDSLRGAESGALLRQLVRRGLVMVARRADAQDREVSYGTTGRFLELFGLGSLEDLPRTQDLQQL